MAELTFEEVNQQIENLNLDQLQQEANAEALDISSKICGIWNKVGVIIKLIAKIPLLPKKWRKALNILIETLDSLCS
ncbi:hypothetical protein [Flagellimonas myxillae]|uniref:hypothetical protein n=1 Tax=Flagellimonas myxillae TaxID=2942214 RepID=UPI00201EF362|nr:hypothetical protein [Muricauda myxillae]MCL6265960.1 hypothetical protein [Muricauda myxillae]